MKLPYKCLNSLGSEEFKHSIRRTKLRDERRHFYVLLFKQLSDTRRYKHNVTKLGFEIII